MEAESRRAIASGDISSHLVVLCPDPAGGSRLVPLHLAKSSVTAFGRLRRLGFPTSLIDFEKGAVWLAAGCGCLESLYAAHVENRPSIGHWHCYRPGFLG